MKVLTWNINGYRAALRRNSIKILFDMDLDIICFQEIKISDLNQIKGTVPEEYHVYINMAENKGKNGVAILTRQMPTLFYTEIGCERFDHEGRMIRLDYGNKLSIVNLYMPHGGRDKSCYSYKLEVGSKIIDYISKIESDNILIAADFNVAHKDIDVERYKSNRNNTMFTLDEKKIIDQLLEKGFIDSFRALHNQERRYSWWPYSFNARERNLGWRIDYIFASQSLKNEIVSVDLLNNIYGSDHCPVLLEIKSNYSIYC